MAILPGHDFLSEVIVPKDVFPTKLLPDCPSLLGNSLLEEGAPLRWGLLILRYLLSCLSLSVPTLSPEVQTPTSNGMKFKHRSTPDLIMLCRAKRWFLPWPHLSTDTIIRHYNICFMPLYAIGVEALLLFCLLPTCPGCKLSNKEQCLSDLGTAVLWLVRINSHLVDISLVPKKGILVWRICNIFKCHQTFRLLLF